MRKIIFDFTGIKQDEISIQDKEPKNPDTEKGSTEEMFDYINNVMENESYGIGLHSTQENKYLNDIMKNGLEIEQGKKTLSTVSSFGTHTRISQEYLKKQMIQYSYGKHGETNQNVIVLVPSIISNSQGQQIYLGFPPYDIECHGNDYRTACVLDTICSNKDDKGRIPSEFILGYYTVNHSSVIFERNPNYIKFLSQEEKDEFFEKIKSLLQGKYKIISDAVISGDIQTLEKLSEDEQSEIAIKIKQGIKSNILERGVNSQLAENLSRSAVQIKQDDSATQALVYVERAKDRESQGRQTLGNNKRKILLEACKSAKLSDLTKAKETLREGIEDHTKNDKGQEI